MTRHPDNSRHPIDSVVDLQTSWRTFFGEHSLDRLQAIVDHARNYYNLGPALDVMPMSSGYENLLLRVRASHEYVLRLTVQRTLEELDAETSFVRALTATGFQRLPEFVTGKDTGSATTALGINMTMYRFIPGGQHETTSDDAFSALVALLAEYFTALLEVKPDPAFEARPVFPSPAAIVNSFRTLCLEPAFAPDADDYVRELPLHQIGRLSYGPAPALIHTDIHPGNVLWSAERIPAAIIDFDDCAFGLPLIEFAAIVRGCCFLDRVLSIERFAIMWRALRRHLGKYEATEVHAAIVSTCLYFLVAVNRERSFGPKRPADWTDAAKAVAIARNVGAVLKILG